MKFFLTIPLPFSYTNIMYLLFRNVKGQALEMLGNGTMVKEILHWQ